MIKINLLAEGKRPTAVRRAKPSRQFKAGDLTQWLLLGTLLVVAAGCFVYWWSLHAKIGVLNQKIAAAQEEVRILAPIIKEVEDYKAKKAELEHKIAVIRDLKQNQRGPVKVMDEISHSLPELLWLTRMEMNVNTIKLWGQAFNTNAVASFTENLDRVPEFQEPDFKETKREGEVYSFSLFLGYRLQPQNAAPEGEAEASGAGGAPAATAPAATTPPGG
jgi:type IV pilus assembly protein PilN